MTPSGPASTYADITRGVLALVDEASAGDNDRTRAAYLVMRAAALIVSTDSGDAKAAEMARGLGEEIARMGRE